MWHNSEAHAREFAERYAATLNYHVENRMMELGIDPAQIGVGDAEHGIRHAAFMPHEVDGGGNTPDGRLNLDSGILNADLFNGLEPEASDAYAKARLRDRVDAGIAHEFEEVKGGGEPRIRVRARPRDGTTHPTRGARASPEDQGCGATGAR